jgi:hypothetical protein
VYEANVSTNSADSPPTYMESRDSHNGGSVWVCNFKKCDFKITILKCMT